MVDSGRQRWLNAAVLAGVIYLAVGITSATLAGAATANRSVLFLRWSAFVISTVVFAAHIGYEHFRVGSGMRPLAWHASVGVAVGAFVLALAANLHDLSSASGYRPRMLIALVAWPLLTAVPAFIVALALAAVLRVKWRPTESRVEDDGLPGK
jgi:hypothetical protein